MGLGINKDLEPLVRAVRRAGGRVEITARTHVLWTMPDGSTLRSGLTMRDSSAQNVRREIERALGIGQRPKAKRPDGRLEHEVAAERRGAVVSAGRKFQVLHPDGGALLNAQGFPRTFSDRGDAESAAASL